MEAIISGILYDTEKATVVLRLDRELAWAGDTAIPVERTVYRGRNGRLFRVTKYPAAKSLIMKALSGSWTDDYHFSPLSENDLKRMRSDLNPVEA